MKTPEQMAEEWMNEEYGDTSHWVRMGKDMSLDAFYAGYQAAKDHAVDVNKMMPKWNSVDTVGDLINRSAIQHTLAALEKKPAQQWISVKDQLPEDNLAVLFFQPEYDGCFVGYKAAEGSYVDPEGNGLSVDNIHKYCTHWRVLPATPKEEA